MKQKYIPSVTGRLILNRATFYPSNNKVLVKEERKLNIFQHIAELQRISSSNPS